MMKKILFMLIAAFAVVSCQEKDVFDQGAVQNKVVEEYNKAFVKEFGQPSPNQDWGFSASALKTRSAYPNSNMWEDEGYVIPADITQAEIDKVLAVFNQKGEEHYESLVDWDCFFVQQVWKGTASYTAGNGGTVVGGDQMDWLCAYDPVGTEETIYPDWNNWQATVVTNHDDHVNNFNNAAGSIMLMINSSTQRFGYKSSTDNGHVLYYFRMEYIDGAYYVGFDFSAEGQNPNEQVQRDFIYNDWIVKIVPGKGTSTTTPEEPSDDPEEPSDGYDKFVGRVFAEDLSATGGTDFDFNDVVFDVYTNAQNQAKVVVLAAGGTLPLWVAGEEVHALFGVGVETMVNTNAGPSLDPVAIYTGINVSSMADLDKITITVKKDEAEAPIELHAYKGAPAAKFAVDQKIDWQSERKEFADKYPLFRDWVGEPQTKWF